MFAAVQGETIVTIVDEAVTTIKMSSLSDPSIQNKVRLLLRHLGIHALRYKQYTLIKADTNEARLLPNEEFVLPIPFKLALPTPYPERTLNYGRQAENSLLS